MELLKKRKLNVEIENDDENENDDEDEEENEDDGSECRLFSEEICFLRFRQKLQPPSN